MSALVIRLMSTSKPAVKSNSSTTIIFVVLAFGITYSIIRYHIAGPVPWTDLPLYVLNKGVSLAAFILLTLNFGLGPLRNLGVAVSEGWLNARKALGMTGFLLVVIHALMSFLLFNPAVYGNFFEQDGSISALAGISMLGGVLGFVFLWAYNLSFQTFLREDQSFINFITSRSCLLVALTLGGAHLLFMGYEGWLEPSGWHGGMPPVSLVAFLFFAMGYIVNVLGRD